MARALAIAVLLLGLTSPVAQAQDRAASEALLAAEAQLATDPVAALKVILPEARRGQPLAQFLLGEAYRTGTGRDADVRLARDWLAKAAAQGEGRAALSLAEIDLSENKLPAAIGWLDRAMAAGEAGAFRRRADLMAAGQGGDADPGGALALYGVALELGDPGVAAAMADLILATPSGDAARARALLASAAALGDGAAMTRLGILYRDGIGGAADPVAAFALLQEAVSLGSPDGAIALAGLMAGDTGYWRNPVLGLAYCLWAVRSDAAFTGACDPIAAPLTQPERDEAARLATGF